jgi:hypothetical protein
MATAAAERAGTDRHTAALAWARLRGITDTRNPDCADLSTDAGRLFARIKAAVGECPCGCGAGLGGRGAPAGAAVAR